MSSLFAIINLYLVVIGEEYLIWQILDSVAFLNTIYVDNTLSIFFSYCSRVSL